MDPKCYGGIYFGTLSICVLPIPGSFTKWYQHGNALKDMNTWHIELNLQSSSLVDLPQEGVLPRKELHMPILLITCYHMNSYMATKSNQKGPFHTKSTNLIKRITRRLFTLVCNVTCTCAKIAFGWFT